MIVGLLLAAGGARRFHSQKLIANFRGEPVVLHAARALAGETGQIIAVVGHEGDAVVAALGPLAPLIVRNPDWELGLAGSIGRGVSGLGADCEAVVIAVGDQPQLDPAVIAAVIARWRESGKPIVSASYRGARAHPVLFAREMFPELTTLAGDAGARLLIERSGDEVSYVEVDAPMPPDVDTPEDLRRIDG